jgi:hypothetical protein
MKKSNDSLRASLKTAIAEYRKVNDHLAPLLVDATTKKTMLLAALGEVIIQFIGEHGQFCAHTQNEKQVRRADKKWYRSMECRSVASHDGFEDLINAAFGHIEWQELYRPALESLDRTKALFFFGMGDCAVALNEQLSTREMESIMRRRHRRIA